MKKILLSLIGLLIGIGMYAEDTTVSFDFSAQRYENGTSIDAVTFDANVKATFDKGTNSNGPKYYTTGTALRLYGANTMTLTTTSGVIKSVSFTFSNSEGSNAINVDNGTFADKTWSGSNASVIFTIAGTSGHRRIKTIEVTYGEADSAPVSVESVAITDAEGNAMGMYQGLVQGESLQLKAVVTPTNATNKKVTWNVLQDTKVISLENGLVKALAPGRAAVTVTTEDGEFQAAVTFIVTEPQPSTIADFIANEGGTCYLTGIVSGIENTTYGNFTLTDKSGSIYVYGCLNAAGESKKFAELGIEEGNEIKVLASEYKLYGETNEAVNVVFVENHGTPASPVNCTFDIAFNNDEFTVIPSVDGVQYFFNILPADGYDTEELPMLFDYLLEEMGEGLDYCDSKETEPLDWWVDTEETNNYIVAVITVNDSYERTSDVTIIPFSAVNMTITSAGYATFVAPFQVAVPTGVKAYTVEAVNGETLTLTQVATIDANTPVVLEGALDETEIWGKNVEGTPVAGLLTGVYEETAAPVGSYVLQNQDKVGFYKVETEGIAMVGANRAYLTVPSSVKAFYFDEATAIKAIESLMAGKAEIYDLNGRKMQSLQKGMNIVNGKKIMVK